MAVSFSTLAQDADKSRDNVRYNIQQRGDQSTSQYGSENQSAVGNRQHTNKGWHKGWDNPESSGSTRY